MMGRAMNKTVKFILFLFPTLFFLAVTNYITYTSASKNSFARGEVSGVLVGKSEVMRELCNYASNSIPEGIVVYSFGVKANLLELYKSEQALQFYCR